MVFKEKYTSNNSAVLFIAGVLVGAGMYISLIGSLSFLLSVTNPVFAIYMLALSNTAFVVFLRFFRLKKVKFSRFSAFSAIIFAFSLWLVNSIPDPFIRALSWYSLSIVGVVFFKWTIFQMSMLHLNPAKAQSQFYYNSRAHEIGTFLVVVLLMTVFYAASPSDIIKTSMVICVMYSVLLMVSLCRKKNIEIRYSRKHKAESIRDVTVFKTMAVFFVAVSLFMGVFETLSSHAVNIYFTEHLKTYDRIIWVMTLIFLFSSVTLIILSAVVSAIVRSLRPSPVGVLAVHALIIAAVTGYIIVYPSLEAFVVLQVLLLSSQGIFHLPGIQMIIASFPIEERAWLSRLHYQYCVSIPNIILAGALTFFIGMQYSSQLQMILLLILGAVAITGVLLVYFRSALIRVFYYNIRLVHKGAAILAAQALSYLNPRDYSDRMIEILQANPKKLLRKTIIIGLGFKGDGHVVNHLCKEFESDKEEVQLSVLDALSKCKDFRGVDFIIEVLTGKHLTRSVNVRMSAAKILAGIYGKRAIPMLLYGLHDEDPRLQANVLEVLSVFKDRTLIGIIKPFIDSPVPRVKANALMALSTFGSQRDLYRQEILNMLSSNDHNQMASALYVVGRNHDNFFLSNVMTILKLGFQDNPMIKRDLALTLTNLHHQKGFELFEELFREPYHTGKQEDFVHLFAQLDYELRFDVLEYMLRKHPHDTAFRDNIFEHLKQATFDFHEEIDYLFA